MQAKIQSSVPACELKTARYGHKENIGVRRQTVKQSTQKPAELTGAENGNMLEMQRGEKRQKKK